MRRTYEAWIEKSSITFSDRKGLEELRIKGLMAAGATFLHLIEADTFEEALAVHHVKMGWALFVPMGEAARCPKGCDSYYYPEGSGECPKCGPVC